MTSLEMKIKNVSCVALGQVTAFFTLITSRWSNNVSKHVKWRKIFHRESAEVEVSLTCYFSWKSLLIWTLLVKAKTPLRFYHIGLLLVLGGLPADEPRSYLCIITSEQHPSVRVRGRTFFLLSSVPGANQVRSWWVVRRSG